MEEKDTVLPPHGKKKPFFCDGNNRGSGKEGGTKRTEYFFSGKQTSESRNYFQIISSRGREKKTLKRKRKTSCELNLLPFPSTLVFLSFEYFLSVELLLALFRVGKIGEEEERSLSFPNLHPSKKRKGRK